MSCVLIVSVVHVVLSMHIVCSLSIVGVIVGRVHCIFTLYLIILW